jgi:hypothetical protein
MADIKISALSALTGANTATDDLYVVVDSSVPETKKQTRAELFQNVPAASFAGANVFNDAGADVDQRIEGDTDANLVYVDASTDRVGIGTATPTAKLQVNGSFAINAPVTVTTNYTVADTASFIISNRAATNTLTLPSAATNTGRILYITNIGGAFAVSSASSNVVPRAGGSAGTAIIPATGGDGAWVMLVCDGTNWIIAAGALGTS